MPDLANVHIDTFLTNVSVAYTNEEYHADDVFVRIPVDKRSDKYPIFNRDSYLRSSGTDPQGKPNSIRRPGTRSTEITFDLSNRSFYCEQFARNYPLTDAEVKLSDAPLQPAINATNSLTDTIMLDNEIAVANKACKRGNYASAYKVQLANGSTSWAAATGKPLSVDIQNGKKQVISGTLRAATNLLVNYASAMTLSQNSEYVTRMQYVTKEALTLAGLVPIVAGLTVVEARTQKQTSAEGVATVTTGYCWVDDQATPQNVALVYYKPPAAPSLNMVAFGFTFEAPDDTLGGRGFLVKRWREEWIDAERIEVRTTRDYGFVATDGSTSGDNSNGFAQGAYLISGTDL